VQWEWLNYDNFKWKFNTVSVPGIARTSNAMAAETTAEILIYPNPVSEMLSIHQVSAGSTISVYNMEGKMMLQQKATASVVNISVKNKLPAGLYIVTIQNDRQRVARKITIL
jgi:hypothetical protein